MKKLSISKNILWIFPIIILLFFAYFPAIVIPHISHDDMNFWLEGNIKFLADYYISLGRVGSAAMIHLFDNIFDRTIAEFTLNVRSLLIFIDAIGCFIFFQIIKKYFPLIESLLLSICIFTLPGITGMINWTVVSGGIAAIPFALLAYAILYNDTSLGKKTRIFLSMIFLQLSLWTYPATAMLFVVPTILKLLFSKEEYKNIKKETILVIEVFFLSMLAYYLITKHILVPILKSKGIYIAPFNPSQEFSLSFNLMQKIAFFSEEIFTISNLWNIYPSRIWSIITFATIALGLCSYCRENKINFNYIKKEKFLICTKIILFFLLLAITTIPFMGPPNPASIYRIYIPSTAAYFLIFYWSIKIIWRNIFIKKFFEKYNQYLAFIFVIPAIFFTQFNNINTARNSELEYNYIKSKISEHLELYNSLEHIHFIQISRWGQPSISYIGYANRGGEEFNTNAIHEVFYGTVNMIFSETAEKRITKKVHRPAGQWGKMFGISFDSKDVKKNQSIRVTCSEEKNKPSILVDCNDKKPGNIVADKNTLIIDMNNLGEKSNPTFKKFLKE